MDSLQNPAFPPQTGTENPTAQPPQGESGLENTVPMPPSIEDGEEPRVPYSRLKSVVEARRDAERRAEEAEERLTEVLERGRSYEPRSGGDSPYQGALPGYWAKMYGDNENSRLAYTYELQRQEDLREEVRREALDTVREERNYETQSLTRNERTLDDRLEDLSELVGRNLTENEQLAILDIADEYTPKDSNGNYAGELITFDKAWEIYALQQNHSSNQQTRQRYQATVATGTPTYGEPATRSEADKNFNPTDWNSFRRRIPN